MKKGQLEFSVSSFNSQLPPGSMWSAVSNTGWYWESFRTLCLVVVQLPTGAGLCPSDQQTATVCQPVCQCSGDSPAALLLLANNVLPWVPSVSWSRAVIQVHDRPCGQSLLVLRLISAHRDCGLPCHGYPCIAAPAPRHWGHSICWNFQLPARV